MRDQIERLEDLITRLLLDPFLPHLSFTSHIAIDKTP
jgi:hypothetical protein